MLEEIKQFGSSQLGFDMEEFSQIENERARKKKNKTNKRRRKNFITRTTLNDVTHKSLNDVTPKLLNDVTPKSFNYVTPKSLSYVTSKSLNDVTPHSLNDVTPKSLNDVTPHSSNDVTPQSLNDVTPQSLNDVTPKLLSDVTETDVTTSFSNDQETTHSTPTEVTTRSLSTNLSAIFADVSFVIKSRKRNDFEINDENLDEYNEYNDDLLNDLNDNLSKEPFRKRKKTSNSIKTDPESLIQSQNSWEESADFDLLAYLTNENCPKDVSSTNGIDLSGLGLDLTEEDSMMQRTNPMDNDTLANSRLISHLEDSLETRSSPAPKRRFRIHRVRRSLPLNESSMLGQDSEFSSRKDSSNNK